MEGRGNFGRLGQWEWLGCQMASVRVEMLKEKEELRILRFHFLPSVLLPHQLVFLWLL
jgi:hypothetical protein